MEYRLNKIDTDLRQKINDATREGLVHGTKDIAVNKDKQQEKRQARKYKLQQQDNNKRLLIEVVKTENIEIETFKEKAEAGTVSKGVYLDIRK